MEAFVKEALDAPTEAERTKNMVALVAAVCKLPVTRDAHVTIVTRQGFLSLVEKLYGEYQSNKPIDIVAFCTFCNHLTGNLYAENKMAEIWITIWHKIGPFVGPVLCLIVGWWVSSKL